MIDEDSPSREHFVAVAAEDAATAISHGNWPPCVVDVDPRISLKHARHSAVPKELGHYGVIVNAFAPPGDLAEKEPLVEPVVDVITFAPTSAIASQFQRRGSPREELRFQGSQDLFCSRILKVTGVARQSDTPVLVTVPAVVEHVGLGADIGVDSLVHVLVKPRALPRRPVFMAQVVDDCASSQVVSKRYVPFLDGTVHRS
jgi:hypothetical protein